MIVEKPNSPLSTCYHDAINLNIIDYKYTKYWIIIIYYLTVASTLSFCSQCWRNSTKQQKMASSLGSAAYIILWLLLVLLGSVSVSKVSVFTLNITKLMISNCYQFDILYQCCGEQFAIWVNIDKLTSWSLVVGPWTIVYTAECYL